jgi:hypothetical protein
MAAATKTTTPLTYDLIFIMNPSCLRHPGLKLSSSFSGSFEALVSLEFRPKQQDVTNKIVLDRRV